MKKINNKLALILLRGVAAVAGFTCTLALSLFTSDLALLLTIWLIGGTIIMVVDDCITNP